MAGKGLFVRPILLVNSVFGIVFLYFFFFQAEKTKQRLNGAQKIFGIQIVPALAGFLWPALDIFMTCGLVQNIHHAGIVIAQSVKYVLCQAAFDNEFLHGPILLETKIKKAGIPPAGHPACFISAFAQNNENRIGRLFPAVTGFK
jgi:hypothetical protein